METDQQAVFDLILVVGLCISCFMGMLHGASR